MKKKISLLMMVSLMLYALVGFADSGAITSQTAPLNDAVTQKIALLDQQILTQSTALLKLKAELASLYALDPHVQVDDNIKESDDDDDDDGGDDERDDGDDERDDENGEDGEESSDDDNSVDGMSNATSVNITEDQRLRVNTLKSQIEIIEKQIDELLSQRDALEKSIEMKVVSPQVGSDDTLMGDAFGVKVLGLNSIQLKGKTFKFDVPPVMKEGRTLVPVRAFTEGLGATVIWDPKTQMVTIRYEGKILAFKLNQKTAWLNGKASTMAVIAENIENRIYVPVRFIAEQLGFKVNWLSASQTIELVKLTTTETAPTAVTPPVVIKPVVVPPTEPAAPVDTVSGATRK